MKAVLKSIVLLTLPLAAHGDVLRLRDGRTIAGYYAGGTDKELWFQSNAVSAESYPTLLVESLQFGPASGTIPMRSSRPAPDAGHGNTGLLLTAKLCWRNLSWHNLRARLTPYLTTTFATAWFS